MAADAPGPGSDAFDPKQHFWDGQDWWTLDHSRWWDGAQWQDADKREIRRDWLTWVTNNLGHHRQLASIAAKAARDAADGGRGFDAAAEAARVTWAEGAKAYGQGFADRQVANGFLHRATTGLAHASVLALLGLSFVVLSTGACGVSVEISGYRVLTGFGFPASDFYLANSQQVPQFGPNPALVVLVIAVLVGVGAAGWGGRKGAIVRLGTALLGIAMVSAATAILPSTIDVQSLTVHVEAGSGPLAIQLLLFISLVIDGQAVLRGYLWERRRRLRGPSP